MAIGGINTSDYKFDVTGTVRATGAMTASAYNTVSGRRFKTQVQPLTNALASIQALRGVRYQWNTLGVQRGGIAGAGQVGFIAQEIEAVYPELVSTGPDGYKAVNYAQLTPVLIEAIKEQQAEIDALKAQNQALQGQAVVDHASLGADHASLVTLQEQMAHLLGDSGLASAKARK